MSEHPAWLNGWQRSSRGWVLEAMVHQRSGWEVRLLPASWLMQGGRLFEPSAPPFSRLPSRSFHLHVPDLSRLSPLLEPDRELTSLVPPARRTRHAVYASADDEQRVFLPAALLLQELWGWTAGTLEVLLTPNSLALNLKRFDTVEGLLVEATGPLARVGASDTSLRRLCWLAQCEDAQSSWSSVLTYAHDGALRLRLPSASLEAWAWGVETPTGTLVAQLSAVSLAFELPKESCGVKTGGGNLYRCPGPAIRRQGFVSFG